MIRRLNIKELTPDSQGNKGRQRHRRLCFYKQEELVLLDPKEYVRPDDPEGDNAVENTTALVSVLQTDECDRMGSLRCRGWFEDHGTEQIYFVFNPPPGCTRNSTFCTMREYMDGFRPSATARLSLAQFLAKSLLCIHRNGYYHKGIRSDSVVFFQRSLSDARSISNPRLIGFDFSRRAGPGRYSEKSLDTDKCLYRHPKALSDPDISFSELQDYYSLGVVLMEIALWKPVKDILQQHQSLQGSSCEYADATEVQAILLGNDPEAENHLRDVAFHMGDRFADAVECCLSGAFGRDIEGPGLWQEFDGRIVSRLQNCII